jgi:zinc protease
MKKLLQSIVFALCILPNVLYANDIQIFKSSKGITAWLMEDHSMPIVSMSFAWRGGGIERDAENKQGLSHIAADMLTKGAGNDDENVYLKKLQDNAISINFQAQRDSVYGQFRSLKEALPLAQNLLRAAIMEPRFDAKALAVSKDQNITTIKHYQADPDWLLSRLMMREVFAGHVYSKRTLGTVATVSSLTPHDLKQWHKQLARDTLMVSVTGDITKEELGALLDQTFGGLPEHSQQAAVPDVDLAGKKQVFVLNYNGPQTSMILAWQGIQRQDKDWYALEVMNYILGGGSFSSRLMSEVREKRGLTYGIASGASLYDHAATYTIQASFKNENAGAVVDLVKKEITRMRDSAVTDNELKAAKSYLTGSYALGLTSTAQVAGHYLEIQKRKFGVNYQREREDALNAVTAADVQRVAQRILQDDAMIAFFVGQPKGITPTQTLDSVK